MNPTMVDCRCKWCRKPMSVRLADRNRGWGKFCSKSCKASDQAKAMGVPDSIHEDPQADQSWGEHEVWR